MERTRPILKERLFGLSNREGNHGEDVKEYCFHLDNTPTRSYARMLYKYPHTEFPYADLVAQNSLRGSHEPEYELFERPATPSAHGTTSTQLGTWPRVLT